MKKMFLFVMVAALLATFAACNEAPAPETTVPTVATTPATQPAPAESTDPLSILRTEMAPPVIAVADFGFPSLSEAFEVMDYLLDEYPQWMAAHDFITNMPDERIIRTGGYEDWNNLLCIVPRDPKASVTVWVIECTDEAPYQKESAAYSSLTGEPILLLANISENLNVYVEVVDSQGNGVKWWPYWENCEPIPESDFIGSQVMYFTPDSEKTAYQHALDYGWTVPGEDFLRDHFWQSSCWDYRLELRYAPGEVYDGEAFLWEFNFMDEDGYSYYEVTYEGCWRYDGGMLHLALEGIDGDVIEEDFPILTDPDGYDWLGIYSTDEGVCLPQFEGLMTYDELAPMGGDTISAYDYAISQGWRLPTLDELVNSEWVSDCGYAMDLLDDGVPGDNAGQITVYDMNENGAYTVSYTGTWSFEDSMLHLLLTPKNADGYFIDDSFPILMLDGMLWIGRNDDGYALPYFYSDMLADILSQPKG